ncbi:ABC transporter permease [Pasteuria penetrans]|uniref:ABC transporter permease n=1 Tax=Pasteuria penetrans TaxID=86005 RepID=UPI000FABE76D|nr:ABC transporter permease subunit [Pasteuria penetrans]
MLTIWRHECSLRTRGLQLLALVAILVGISIALSTQYTSFLQSSLGPLPLQGLALRILHLLIMLFGFLLVLTLSHGSMERDLQSGRLRLYLTRLSYGEVILGKFLGILTFWIITVTMGFLILSLFYSPGSWYDLSNMYAILVFSTGITILLSSHFRNSSSILLIGMVLWLALITLGLTRQINQTTTTLHWITPMFWVDRDNPWVHTIPIALGTLSCLASIPILRRRGV